MADLEEGKRGRFKLKFYDQAGWSPSANKEIRVGDHIPEKPWLVFNYSVIHSEGRGRNKIETDSVAVVFIVR